MGTDRGPKVGNRAVVGVLVGDAGRIGGRGVSVGVLVRSGGGKVGTGVFVGAPGVVVRTRVGTVCRSGD